MKQATLNVSLIFVFFFLGFTSAIAQDNSNPLKLMTFEEAQMQKSSGVSAGKEINILKTFENRKLISITNPQLIEELSLDVQRKEFIGDLPGIIDMATFKSEGKIQIMIYNDYVNEYLIKYFGFKEAELSNINTNTQ